MSSRFFLAVVLAGSIGIAVAHAKDKKPAGTMVRNPAPTPPPPPPAAPMDPDLTTYYFALITKGPNFEAYDKEDRTKIQSLHMRNMERMASLGKLLVAGPFSDNGDWRGIFIFKCASLEEARALAATDPAVATGRFKIEVHPWMTEKGALRDPEFAAKPAAKP